MPAKTKYKNLETSNHITTTIPSAGSIRIKTIITKRTIKIQKKKYLRGRGPWLSNHQRNRLSLGIKFTQKKKFVKTLWPHRWWSTRRAIWAQAVQKRGISKDPPYLWAETKTPWCYRSPSSTRWKYLPLTWVILKEQVPAKNLQAKAQNFCLKKYLSSTPTWSNPRRRNYKG